MNKCRLKSTKTCILYLVPSIRISFIEALLSSKLSFKVDKNMYMNGQTELCVNLFRSSLGPFIVFEVKEPVDRFKNLDTTFKLFLFFDIRDNICFVDVEETCKLFFGFGRCIR